jgi:hypothetical protein
VGRVCFFKAAEIQPRLVVMHLKWLASRSLASQLKACIDHTTKTRVLSGLLGEQRPGIICGPWLCSRGLTQAPTGVEVKPDLRKAKGAMAPSEEPEVRFQEVRTCCRSIRNLTKLLTSCVCCGIEQLTLTLYQMVGCASRTWRSKNI